MSAQTAPVPTLTSVLGRTERPRRGDRAAAAGRGVRPDCARPRTVVHRPVGRSVGCQVVRPVSEPTWELTRRGLAVAMVVVALVTGSALVAVVSAFLSVSDLPL